MNVNSTLITKMLNSTGPFGKFLATYNMAITVFLGIVTITIITLLFMNVTKMSVAGDNAGARQEAIHNVLICLICLGLCGGIDTVYGVLLSVVFAGN